MLMLGLPSPEYKQPGSKEEGGAQAYPVLLFFF